MQNQMLSIFKALTPDNIKDLPVISDSVEIFIELLAENAKISKDIKIALSEDTTASIEEELPKVYLYDYFNMIENLRTNKTVVNKFQKWNEALNPQIYPVGMPVIGERLVVDYFMIGQEGGILQDEEDENEDKGESQNDDAVVWNINPLSKKLDALKHNILQNKAENYYINRKFKESKGLKKSIFFIYDIMNEHIVNPDEKSLLKITETGNPFEFDIISGSIDRDIYKQSVAYLSHPLGFTYTYRYISELRFKDDYGLRKVYNVRMLEVRCLNGNVEKYTKEVIYIEQKTNYLKIVFVDGTYLLQANDAVSYYSKHDILIKSYPPSYHCSIFIDYNIEYRTTYEDNIKFEIKEKTSDEFKMDDSALYKYTLNIGKGFIIGSGVIGEVVLNDTESYNVSADGKDYIGFESKEILNDKFKIEDSILYKHILDISKGFTIGLGVIGEVVLNDPEIYNVSVDGKDNLNLVTPDGFMIGFGLIGSVVIDNESTHNTPNNNEVFDVLSLEEDFHIEIL